MGRSNMLWMAVLVASLAGHVGHAAKDPKAGAGVRFVLKKRFGLSPQVSLEPTHPRVQIAKGARVTRLRDAGGALIGTIKHGTWLRPNRRLSVIRPDQSRVIVRVNRHVVVHDPQHGDPGKKATYFVFERKDANQAVALANRFLEGKAR